MGDNEDGKVDKTTDNAEILRRLAEKLRKHERFVPRPPNQRATEAVCERFAQERIPPEAGVASITFNATRGEVTIVAARPGMAIGRLGAHPRAIQEATGWKVIILRPPPGQTRE